MPIPEGLNSDSSLAYAQRIEEARKRLIVALDVPNANAAAKLVDQLENTCQWFKVGLEVFVSAGPAVIAPLVARGHSVFLDLKLYDIPNTVAAAVRSATALGVRMMTLHAAGGPAMMAAAHEALDGVANPPQLLAVTVLTSMDQAQVNAVGLDRSPAEQVALLRSGGPGGWYSRLCLLATRSCRLARSYWTKRCAGHPRYSPGGRGCRRSEAHCHSRRSPAPRCKLSRRWPPHHTGAQPGRSRRSNSQGDGRSSLTAGP